MSDSPIARLEGSVAIYRASSIGRCIRAIVAIRLGFDPLPPSKDLQTIFKEGHRHEQHIVEDLRAQGYEITNVAPDGSQFSIRIKVAPKVEIHGHLDGFIEDKILECKAVSKDTFDKLAKGGPSAEAEFLSHFGYAEQITLYMEATGKRAFYAVKNRNSGKIYTFVIDTPPCDLAAIKARILKAEIYAENGELPDCDTTDRWNCPVRYLHDDSPGDATYNEAIEALAATYDEARKKESEGAAAKKEAQKRLKEAVGDAEKVESANFKVSQYIQKTDRFDQDKARAELGNEVIDRYVVTAYSSRMRVTNKRKAASKKGAAAAAAAAAEPAPEAPTPLAPEIPDPLIPTPSIPDLPVPFPAPTIGDFDAPQ